MRKFIELENRLIGYQIRLKEIHYSTKDLEIHRLTDEFLDELREFEDNLMENVLGLSEDLFLTPGTVKPILPMTSMNFPDLLQDIRAELLDTRKDLEELALWSGPVSIIDDFLKTINKTVYKTRLM